MQCFRKVTEDLYWVGGNDRQIELFENIFPLAKGVSYNSYLLLDEQTVLFDTADYAIGKQFIENVMSVLNGRNLDYIVVNHMEPDHCSLIGELLLHYPDVKIIGNAKTFPMIEQFFSFDLTGKTLTVKEGDTFCIRDSNREWLDEARRYYTNIVGKYGPQVQNVLKKASSLDIQMICPLHGPVWRSNLNFIIEKYNLWSRYEPEEKGVMIAYASMYGNTENMAEILAVMLAEAGVKNIHMHNISKTHVSELISDSFKYSHIVLASPTYNNGIYPLMDNYLEDMKALSLQNRTIAVLGNGSWAPQATKLISAKIKEMKNMRLLEASVTIKSSLKEAQLEELNSLSRQIAEEVL